MTAPVLVTGGTGTLGRHVVARLRDAGRDVRVLSRHRRDTVGGVEYVTGDLDTGEGVQAAAAGVATVVHCAGSQTGDGDKAHVLVRALAPSTHLLYISVVGADRIPQVGRADRTMFGYFGSKLDGERVVAGSGLPYTTLRATQFHELVLMAVEQMARLPIVPVPAGFRVQPVDADDVAARLTDLALGPPAGLVAEMGGPRVYGMAHLVRGYLRAVGRNRPVVPVGLPGQAARAFRDGANLAPGPAAGHRTWEDFLHARLATTVGT